MRPRQVRILGAPWDISWLPEKRWPSDHKDSDGITHAHQHEILIRTGKQTEDVLRDTLLHEIIHACLSMTSTTHLTNLAPRDQREEILVATLTPVLLDILRDNSGLTAYLTGL